MSQRAFQAALSRLALEPGLRERVRCDGEVALPPGLTGLERRRLTALAADPGMELTAFLIRGFRLGKILALLPLTNALLGPARLAAEGQLFWRSHPPRSFYFLEEALAFCDHLLERTRRGLRAKYLDEVVAYERAMLELRRVRPNGSRPAPQRVAFRHDPAGLLETLAAGRRPRGLPEGEYLFVATLDDGGAVRWLPERTP